jgi:hypothetical protein
MSIKYSCDKCDALADAIILDQNITVPLEWFCISTGGRVGTIAICGHCAEDYIDMVKLDLKELLKKGYIRRMQPHGSTEPEKANIIKGEIDATTRRDPRD